MKTMGYLKIDVFFFRVPSFFKNIDGSVPSSVLWSQVEGVIIVLGSIA